VAFISDWDKITKTDLSNTYASDTPKKAPDRYSIVKVDDGISDDFFCRSNTTGGMKAAR
jgi:hypothetical protein